MLMVSKKNLTKKEYLKRQLEKELTFEITSPDEEITLERGREAFYELREQVKKNGIQGMSLDEINEEIRLTREEMRRNSE